MKQIKKLAEDINYTAIDLGNLNDLMKYSLIHPANKQEIEGKVFLKDAIKSTGSEVSFNSLPPKSSSYHSRNRKNSNSYV